MDQRQWYALKVFHNRMPAIADELTAAGIESYIPMQTVVTERSGIRRKEQRPAIASLMFFHATRRQAEDTVAC